MFEKKCHTQFIYCLYEVKDKIYPGPEHTVFMSDEELKKFAKDMKWEKKLAELD